MLEGVRFFVTDLDYIVKQPRISSYFHVPYRMLRRIDPELTEHIVELPSKIVAIRLLEYFAEHALLKLGIFNGVSSYVVDPNLLRELQLHGIVVGFFTRLPRKPVEKDLSEFPFRPGALVCGDDVGLHGYLDHDYIAETIRRLGGVPQESLVASDSPSQLLKGKAIGARTLGIPSYHSEKAIRRANPDYIRSSLQEGLQTALARFRLDKDFKPVYTEV